MGYHNAGSSGSFNDKRVIEKKKFFGLVKNKYELTRTDGRVTVMKHIPGKKGFGSRKIVANKGSDSEAREWVDKHG